MSNESSDGRRNNGCHTGRPVDVPDGYDWTSFMRRHGRRIRFTVDGCWLWTGATFKGGYGAVRLSGQAVRAHRLTWTLLVGELPVHLTIDHLCRRTSCLNPDHMELVDAGENRRRAPIAGWAKVHAAKVTCDKGHPFDRVISGQRVCGECRRAIGRRYAAKKRAERKATAA